MKPNRSQFIISWHTAKYADYFETYSIAPISVMLPNECNTKAMKILEFCMKMTDYFDAARTSSTIKPHDPR
jgi:hypothetical protein